MFAARDRYDERYDTVRAVRDQRLKYIRHYHPEEPFLRYNRYRNNHPIMQEIWRLHAAGELTGPQNQLFAKRPVEELYDTVADPHEINNLAADPAFRTDIERLRAALDGWQKQVGDLGLVSEDQMVGQMWPDGQQPTTLPPMFVLLGGDEYGITESPNGGELEGPILLQMQSSTQGASIAYTFETGDHPSWRLYHQPLRLATGTNPIRAKAIRIGYKESAEVKADFYVR